MPTAKHRSLGVILATIILLVAGGFSPAVADSFTAGNQACGTPPAPTKEDPSGTDQDRYYIPVNSYDVPASDQGYYDYYYFVGSQTVYQGLHPTGGAKSITITLRAGSYPDMVCGTWVLDFNTSVTGTEAPNTYRVVVGGCYADHSRKVTAYFTNVADATHRVVAGIHVTAEGAGDDPVVYFATVLNIADGATAALYFTGEEKGLPSHRKEVYTFNFSRKTDTGAWQVVATVKKTLPACSSSASGGSGGSTGKGASGGGKAAIRVPRVVFKPSSCKRAKLVLYGPGAARAKFSIALVARGKTVHFSRTVAKGKPKRVNRLLHRRIVKIRVVYKAHGKKHAVVKKRGACA